MARGPVKPGALGTKEQQQAARAAAIAKITELLGTGPMTSGDILRIVGGNRSTLMSQMQYMHETLRRIRKTGESRNYGALWELGADEKLPSLDDQLDQIIAPKRGIGPAKQIGMWRDYMVAALFGPARGARA